MSDPQEQLWSDNPNAPKISRTLYLDEKADFAGNLIASILYGMLNARLHLHLRLFVLSPFGLF